MKVLKAEELTVGQIITVYEWEPYPSGQRDRSWQGDLFEVKAIDLPFIVASFFANTGYKGNHKFDTRQTHFAQPSVEYIAALTAGVAA